MRQFLHIQPNLHYAENFPAIMRYLLSTVSPGKAVRRFAAILAMMLLFSSGIMAVTTITVTGLSIGTQICPGSQTNVNFIVDTIGGATMPAGTYTWAIELSDPNGNFPGTLLVSTPPTDIGASLGYVGTAALGPVSLPASLAQSNLYRIRITVNGYPAVNSVASPALDARRELLAPTVPAPLQYNAGANITVTVNPGTCGFNSGNAFTVQLSNASGSFASPVNLTPTLNNSTGGNVTVTIPANTLYGTGYRIRTISSDPALTSPDNGSNITILCSNPTNGGQIGSSHSICTGNVPSPFTSISLPSGHTGTLEYQWQKSIASASSGFNNINGSNSTTFTETATLTQTTWYRRLAKVTCESSWVESNVVQVTVNPTRLFVTESGAGLMNGSSWDNAFSGSQLQTAINAQCVTEVWVAAGTYKPTSGTDRNISFSMKNGVAIYGGFNGTETQLSERDWVSNETILSGNIGEAGNNTDNSFNVIRITDPSIVNTSILNGFIIESGFANGGSEPTGYGGGMYAYKSSPSIFNCIFRNNYCQVSGAGVYVNSPDYTPPSPILFANCGFFNNQAYQVGGAIRISYGSAMVTNCTVFGNTSGNPGTGGIFGNATINNCIIWGNSSGNQTEDPLFVDAANGNLRLQPCSPAINAGDNTAVPAGITTDLDGNPRFYNNGIVDMGAYEYQGEKNINPTNGGQIASSQVVCIGDVPAPFTSISPASGFVGDLEYQWQISTDSPTFDDILGAVYETYTHVGTVTQTTWFRRLAKVTCESSWVESNVIQIYVETLTPPTASVTSKSFVYGATGTPSLATTGVSVSYSGIGTGQPNLHKIVWVLTGKPANSAYTIGQTFTTDNCGDAFKSFGELAVSNTSLVIRVNSMTPQNSGNPIIGTYTFNAYAVRCASGCESSLVGSFSIIVSNPPPPTASAGGSATICATSNHTVSGASASNGTILWSHNGSGTISDATTLTPTYNAVSADGASTVSLTMTVTSPYNFVVPQTATASYTINVYPIGLRTWTGTTDADWNTDTNWNPPCVPTAADDIIIPDVSNDPVIGAGIAAVAKSVTLSEDAALTVVETGSLTINGSSLHEFGLYAGFYNHGSVTNDGLIALGTVSSVGEVGLWNIGTFTNTGEIQIDRSTLSALWSSGGQFTNSSLIHIGAFASVDDYGVYNDASFINTADGQIVINNFTYRGIENRAGAIDNSGGITIGFVSGTGQRSIMNQALFNNNPGGEIFLDRATAAGVYNDAAGLFNNAALLSIGGTVSVGQYGIQNIGTFTNTLSGEIYIDRCAVMGLYNNGGGSKFINAALLVIGNTAGVGSLGIGNEGAFTNTLNSTIHIDRSTDIGFSSVGPVTNSGLIKFGSKESVGLRGLQNAGSDFTNTATGEIHIDRTTELGVINADAQFINEGKMQLGVNNPIGKRGINNQGASNFFLNSATGEITIDRTTEYAFVNAHHTNENAGKLVIGNHATVDGYGIFLFFSAGLNNTGAAEIRIDRTTNSGIYVEAGSTFTNDATIITGEAESYTSTYGIQNEGIFTNGQCAVIRMHAPLSNLTNFTNNGLLTTITTEQHAGIAVVVNSPGGVAGAYNFAAAGFGGDVGSGVWTADAVLVSDAGASSLGCYAPYQNAAQLAGKIALIDRGTCQFGLKCLLAEQAGAIAVIVINNIPGPAFIMGAGDYGNLVTIPCVLISKADGDAIKAAGAVNMSMGNIATPANAVINNGIIEFPLGNPIASIDNNQVVVAPFSGDCSESINPALQLDEMAGFEIAETWYIDENLTIPAGNYDQLSNTFLPLPTLSGNVTTLYFIITDPVGGCTSTVSVQVSFNDDLIPDVVCKNITVYLDGNSVTVYAEDVNDGSTDNCSDPAELILSPASITFTCDHIGTNSFVLTVTDAKGNAASSTATVTVLDVTPPTLVGITKTIYLDPYGMYTLLDTDVLNFGASTDNCGPISITDIIPGTFTCDDLGGVFTVQVQAEDPSGNSASCLATISVEQGTALLPPWVNSNTHLNANGTAIYSPCDNEGSFRLTSTGQSTTTNDVFHFVYQQLCGNGTVIARLDDVTNGGYAGVMMRESNHPAAKTVLFKTLLYNPNVLTGTRTSQGQAMRNASHVAQLIRWMKIQRNGNNFKVFTSYNGTTWHQRNSVNITMNSCIMAGVFTESVRSNRTSTAWFDHVEVVNFLKSDELLAATGQSFKESAEWAIELYPNPAANHVVVKVPANKGLVKYAIYDLNDRLLSQSWFIGEETQLNIRQMQPGVYILRFETEGIVLVKKLIVM